MEEHGALTRVGKTVLELATTPSMNGTTEGGEGRDKIQGAPSTAQDTETSGALARPVALPNNIKRRNYAEAIQGSKGKTFKMTIKSRQAHPEKIKQLLRNKSNREKLG